MVLEGWLPDYAIQEGLAQLRPDSHERVFATGGPLPRGDYLSDYGSYAAVAAATAIRLGLSSNQVSAVPSGAVYRNRTFASALALRDYCRSNGVVVDKLNLVSLGAHARRSQLCFQRAFGADVDIGILAIENREYDPRRWWRFSQGIKEVGGESLAWAYAWLSLDYGD